MAFLEKFDKFNRMFSGCLQWVGFAGLLVMVFITCIDVIGAKIFRAPVFGSIDIAMVSQVVAISFAGASALILGRHIQVEFFMVLLPKRIQAVIDSIIHLLGLALFILIVWRLCLHGYTFQTGAEETATARIPLYPFAYGVALAGVPVCLIFIQRFLEAIVGIVKR
jgi:TRAP-type C4-dicarboxylate transport system permease small subunit